MNKKLINGVVLLFLTALVAANFVSAEYFEDVWSDGAIVEADGLNGGGSGGVYVTVPSGATAELVTFAATFEAWATSYASISGPQSVSSSASSSGYGVPDEEYNSTTGGAGTYYLYVNATGFSNYAVAQMAW